MINYKWKICNLTRDITNDFVVQVDYLIYATEDTYSASIYGSINYTQTEGETFIPFNSLTEDIVVDWVQNLLGKNDTESNLQDQINAQKNPTTITEMPWSQRI
jgi:hypothetical protein